MSTHTTHPLPVAADSDRPGVVQSIGLLIIAGFKGATTALLVHSVLIGLLMAGMTFWTLQTASLLRALSVGGTLLSLHLIASSLIIVWSALYAAGQAAPRTGIVRTVLHTALRRAGALSTRIQNANDLATLGKSLREAFNAMEREPLASAGRWPRLRRFIARRIIRAVATLALAQLDLMPDELGALKHATLEDWLCAHINSGVSSALSAPAIRGIAIALALQAVLSVGLLSAAASLPPFAAAGSSQTPSVPFLSAF